MRKVSLILALLFSGTSSLAARSEFYEAVMKHEDLHDLSILKLEQTMSYRCLGCYDFEVTILKEDDKRQTMKFQTSTLISDLKISVRRK